MRRLDYISIIRIFSVFSIIAFHSLCFYGNNWLFLHTESIPIWKMLALPIVKVGLFSFFVISGFLFGFNSIENSKYENTAAFIFTKIQRIMLPYLIWSIIMVAAFSFFFFFYILIGAAHL